MTESDLLADIRALHYQDGALCGYDGFVWPCVEVRMIERADEGGRT